MKALEKAVKTMHEEYLSALKNADAEAFIKLFQEDAIVLSPGSPMLRGKDAIRRDKEAIFARATILGGVVRTLHLEQSGNLAYEVGRFSYTVKVGESDSRIVEGKYVTIWKRAADGVWRYQVDAGLPD